MLDKYLDRINFLNQARRVPICFCIDTSYSMRKIVEGAPTGQGKKIFKDGREYVEFSDEDCSGCKLLIDKVNEGIRNFYEAIKADDMACDSCEAAIITFNDEPLLYDNFSEIDEKENPDFGSLNGDNSNFTPAIRMAIDLLAERKALYKRNGISSYQPWLVLFTDGLPSDDVTVIKSELMAMQEGPTPQITVYTMALSEDRELLDALAGFSKKPPVSSNDPKEIKRFFEFLARSVSVVAGGGIPEDIF